MLSVSELFALGLLLIEPHESLLLLGLTVVARFDVLADRLHPITLKFVCAAPDDHPQLPHCTGAVIAKRGPAEASAAQASIYVRFSCGFTASNRFPLLPSANARQY